MVVLSDKRYHNLLSYKYYILPTARYLYGTADSESKHQKNVQRILRILSLNGPMTTWEMAKVKFTIDADTIRTKEKEYRRLLIGRTDRGRFSKGLVDLDLVLSSTVSSTRGKKYRLSLYGILFCLDVLQFEKDEIDKLAKNYKDSLPLVFGKWDSLKSIIGENVYNIHLLGKGLLFDNLNIISVGDHPKFNELISYFNIKSRNITKSLNEKKLGELISLWFFTTLLYFPKLIEKDKKDSMFYLTIILRNDPDLKRWFLCFIEEAQKYYERRSKILEEILIV